MVTLKLPLHVALTVTDLDRADWFYGQVLGLVRVERSLSFPGIWYQLGHFQIHLMAVERGMPGGPEPALLHPSTHPKWGRNPHLAFAVADLVTAQARLEAADCPIQISTSGRAALFTRDPDGNVIELSQVGNVECQT